MAPKAQLLLKAWKQLFAFLDEKCHVLERARQVVAESLFDAFSGFQKKWHFLDILKGPFRDQIGMGRMVLVPPVAYQKRPESISFPFSGLLVTTTTTQLLPFIAGS